jgi:hypothetical protein
LGSQIPCNAAQISLPRSAVQITGTQYRAPRHKRVKR